MTTIGELKKLIKDLPDDMTVVGYDGSDYTDYTSVNFYVHDRTEDKVDLEEEKQKWWWGDKEIPDKVFVCNTD